MKKPTRHTVRGKAEETDCDHCGAPIYSGDSLYTNDDHSGKGYCSPRCAAYQRSDEERLPDWAKR